MAVRACSDGVFIITTPPVKQHIGQWGTEEGDGVCNGSQGMLHHPHVVPGTEVTTVFVMSVEVARLFYGEDVVPRA